MENVSCFGFYCFYNCLSFFPCVREGKEFKIMANLETDSSSGLFWAVGVYSAMMIKFVYSSVTRIRKNAYFFCVTESSAI